MAEVQGFRLDPDNGARHVEGGTGAQLRLPTNGSLTVTLWSVTVPVLVPVTV